MRAGGDRDRHLDVDPSGFPGAARLAITVDDEIHRWGDNDSGELGRQGPSSSRPQPATVLFGAEPT